MHKLWFKRKLFGWGWYPATWQGWVITLIYVVLVVLLGLTIDENSPSSEIAFTFLLPVVFLTILFIRISYAKGEKPRWQWRKPNVQGAHDGYLFKLDKGNLMGVAVFNSKEEYTTNANDPEQDQWFQKLRKHLEEEPEWHDGEIVVSDTHQ